MVHGNQKAVVGEDSTEITDLDRETITHIDNLHKTYSVVTFAQMRQAFENMPKQMEQAQQQAKQDQPQQPQQPKSDLKTTFDVSVKNTGVTKDVNGLTAQEQLVTMQMHMTDPNAPPTDATNTVTYVVTTDAWIAPDPPEVKEVQDFDKRFGQKLMAGVDMSAWRSQMAGQILPWRSCLAANPDRRKPWPRWPKKWQSFRAPGSWKSRAWVGAGMAPAPRKTRHKRQLLRLPHLPRVRTIQSAGF